MQAVTTKAIGQIVKKDRADDKKLAIALAGIVSFS
jgi:hypothetical protein